MATSPPALATILHKQKTLLHSSSFLKLLIGTIAEQSNASMPSTNFYANDKQVPLVRSNHIPSCVNLALAHICKLAHKDLMKNLFCHIFSSLSLLVCFVQATEPPFLLLQIFGTEQRPGRTIAGNTERDFTWHLAQEIKAAVNEDSQNINVLIVSNASLDQKAQLETINKINQLDTAIVVQLTASQSNKPQPSCNLFFRSYNPLTDQIKRPFAPLTPIPFEDAYLLCFGQSKVLAQSLAVHTREVAQDFLEIKDPVGVPLANLRGIKHPVIQIEIEVDQKSKRSQIGETLAQGLRKILPS
jgi:hypothetical protein